MAKSNETFSGGPFGAGGMVAALFMPITIVITSILVMCNAITPEELP